MKKALERLTTKIALTAAVALLIIWGILGSGASLAWFTDEAPTVNNTFHFAEFDMLVEYKNHAMDSYAPVEIDTNIFVEDALYEPGYTQVVYLKVKNGGTVPLRYKLTLDVRATETAPGVLGNEVDLTDHLKYGVLFADTEQELTREIARQNAQSDLSELTLAEWSEWDSVTVAEGEERYVALIVSMPESVGNEANFTGENPPTVNLALTVYAQQLTK